jgi:subtilisin family serine protease
MRCAAILFTALWPAVLVGAQAPTRQIAAKAPVQDYTIHWLDSNYRPPVGVARGLASKVTTAIRARQASYGQAPAAAHIIVQFYAAPTSELRKSLSERGVSMQSAIDPRTWQATATPAGAAALQRMKEVRWADVPPRVLKLSPRTSLGHPFEWQKRSGGRLAFSVLFADDVSGPEIAATATRLGAQLEGFNPRAIGIIHLAIVVIAPVQLDALVASDIVEFIEPVPPPDVPDNLKDTQPLSHVDALRGTSFVDTSSIPFHPTGVGITVGVWEAVEKGTSSSAIRNTHVELNGRVTYGTDLASPAPTVFSNHGTHVAGTIASSGAHAPGISDSDAENTQGMAPAANLQSWSSASDASEMATAAGAGGTVRVSNHSYGIGIGWNDAGAKVSDFTANLSSFGLYDITSQSFDDVVNNTGLLIFKSAGNDRDDRWRGSGAAPAGTDPHKDCTTGTSTIDADCIDPRGVAKNIFTIGAMADATNIADYSSFGPTDDGRIKPDLVARGSSVFSTTGGSDTATGTLSGTSMSTPAAAGIAALMLEIANRRAITMTPEAMKALLIETAIDVKGIGQSTEGPDYATGWGIIDAAAAGKMLGAAKGPGLVQDSLTADGLVGTRTYPIYVAPGLPELKVTLAWSDPSGPNLINDLDLRLFAPGDTTSFSSWLLDPANPGNAAVRDGGDDNRNNVEQVSVLNPAPGVWQATVSADPGTLGLPPQNFALAGPVTGLGIIAPTHILTANGGGPDWGSRVLVRVQGSPALDLSRTNLRIVVAGTTLTDAQIPTLSPVGGDVWAIIAPGPKPVGCYDLRVSLISPNLQATEPQSICYTDDKVRQIERVVALDRSNSMRFDSVTQAETHEKLNAAKDAAKFFIDLANPQDQIGVVSFQRDDENKDGNIDDATELSQAEFSLQLAGEGSTDSRPAGRAAIDNVNPDPNPGFTGPETSIGSGLKESATMINGGARAGAAKVTVMITDGLENYPPYWSRTDSGTPLRPTWDRSIRLDTVGAGNDVDDGVLFDMSSFTGGQYIAINEGQGSFGMLSRLAAEYKAIDEDIRDEQRFFYREGYPTTPLGTNDRPVGLIADFTVEPHLDWMTVAFHANIDNTVETKLLDPNGVEVTAAYPATTVHRDPKHIVFRIRTPKGGKWFYMVPPNPTANVEYYAVASGPTVLKAKVGPGAVQALAGGIYAKPIRVWIADKHSVTGASVTGYVRRPDKVKIPIALFDNGASEDGKPSDGIYGFRYIDGLSGPYYVHLEAHGVSSAGEPFDRYLSTSFVIPGPQKTNDQVGEGGEPSHGGRPVPTGGACDCDPAGERPWAVSVFGGMTFPQGNLNTRSDSAESLGLELQRQWNSMFATGLYLGHDRFKGTGGNTDLSFTHLSPELEFTPVPGLLLQPSFHVGAGVYQDQDSNTDLGFNAGVSLRLCLTNRAALIGRYDNRNVDGGKAGYSTVQIGLRVTF